MISRTSACGILSETGVIETILSVREHSCEHTRVSKGILNDLMQQTMQEDGS